ncbi:hypothetical protein V6N12_061345 [Hibiscus sabdariffa]|uniref:RING-type E3 ubiquitin transferase n=1 Tax=Hibiscus sabdariffa TaxID=183260 RepID=A0ABR2DWT2_9ROSI
MPSISLVMLVILNLGHMVPLALDSEILCSNKQDPNRVFAHNSGLVELSEVQPEDLAVPLLLSSSFGYQHHSMKSYAGLIMDSFLLPQILVNMFSNSKHKALSCSWDHSCSIAAACIPFFIRGFSEW